MSIAALMKGVEKRLRSEEVFDDRPTEEIGRWVGRTPAPGRPPRNFGQFFCSVHWSGGNGNDTSRKTSPSRHDVSHGVVVTLTARLNYAPRDRQAIRLGTVDDVYDLVDRIAAPNIIHGNWATINYANAFIVGTQANIDVTGIGTATVNGFMETLVLERFGPEREATGDWVGSETAAKDVYVIDIRFGLARRMQENYEPRV